VAVSEAGSRPAAVFCAPLYDNAAHLPETLESLLGQTRADLALVLVDDCSPDETVEVARSFAARDSRISVYRNPERLGMLHNTRRAHLLARRLYPDSPYLAYASDHDLWAPEWLERLTAPLEEDPRVVLSYPSVAWISPEGELVERRGRVFDTRGNSDPEARFRATHRAIVAGDMVYGLFRAAALDRIGPYRRVLMPDRLMLAEVALQGEFAHLPEYLWSRRLPKTSTLARQRAAFFPGERALLSRLPWWTVHAGVLGWRYGVLGAGAPEVSHPAGARLAAGYLAGALEMRARVLRRRRARSVRRHTRRLGRRMRRLARRLRGHTPRGAALVKGAAVALEARGERGMERLKARPGALDYAGAAADPVTPELAAAPAPERDTENGTA